MALGYNAPGVAYDSAYNYDGTGGVEALSGTASGTSTTSGSAVGREGSYGTVNGSSTTSGSAVGREGSYGVVNGSSTTSGSAVGSGGDTGDTGGTGAYLQAAMRRPRRRTEPRRKPVHKTGSASGRTRTRGYAIGHGELTLDDEEALVLLGAL